MVRHGIAALGIQYRSLLASTNCCLMDVRGFYSILALNLLDSAKKGGFVSVPAAPRLIKAAIRLVRRTSPNSRDAEPDVFTSNRN
jgi:hypothetical protein